MTLWLVHFDDDLDDGDIGESASEIFDLAAGDYGEGQYFIVEADGAAGAIAEAIQLRKGTQ